MGRMRTLVSGCAIAGLTITMVLVSAVSASDRQRPRSSDHSLVGAWILDTNTQATQDPPALLTVAADGTLRLTDCCNGPGAGVWAPSSTRTADATLFLPYYDDDGFVGFQIIRADVVSSIDANSLTATYTAEIPARDGTTSGQLGPVSATGTRMSVEPIGDPVGPLPVPTEAAPDTSPTPSTAPTG